MATISKRGSSWFAQIRRKGHKSISKSFPTKGMAQEWSRKIEREMDTMDFKDGRGVALITLSDLIDRYKKDLGEVKPFGKNKAAVIESLKRNLGSTRLPELTTEKLTEHIDARMKEGAGGVTIAIELTYLGSIYRAAKQLWKLPVDSDFISSARANLHYRGVSTKSKERERRPTKSEIDALCAHYAAKKRQIVPMPDLILFAIETAMRLNEIISLKWSDLNESDKTIIIRDRKHPTEKQGNDQEVPLLGDAFAIVKRQPSNNERIFPVTDGTVSSIFPRACQALKIKDLRFHDLRHEGVSRLFEQGLSIMEVSLISGHRSLEMLKRYTNLKATDISKKYRSDSYENLPKV